jgi:hypothetical protein
MNVSALAGSIVKSPLTRKVVLSIAGLVAAYGAKTVTGQVYDNMFDPSADPFKGTLG